MQSLYLFKIEYGVHDKLKSIEYQYYEVVQPMTIYNTAIYYYFSADHIMFITPDFWKPFAHHSSLRKIYS